MSTPQKVQHGMDVPSGTEIPEGFELGDGVRRDSRCVEKWPACTDSAYDPACCRFPKSCSATSVPDRVYRTGILEPAAEAAAAPKELYAVMVPTSYGHDLQCTLVEDTGEVLSSWISSNKHWGRRDLLAELARKYDPAIRFPDGYEVVEADRWSDVPEAVLSAYRVHVAEAEKAAGVRPSAAADPREDVLQPQAVDREALAGLVTFFRAQREGCEQLRAANEETGADLTAIDYYARAETWGRAAEMLQEALLGEVDEGRQPDRPTPVCTNCKAETFACTACGAQKEDI